MASSSTSILIVGGDADGNLGDRAILQATCRTILSVRPDVRLWVVTSDVASAGRRYGATGLPRGVRGFPSLVRAARRSGLVLFGGGGLLQDDDSLIKVPYWGMRLAVLRLCRPRVVGYALGVGPLAAASSHAFANLAFACMERISVRDERARAVADGIVRPRSVEVLPDPALLLEPASREEARAALRNAGVPLNGAPLIGVAPRRWFPPRHRLIPHKLAHRLGLPDPHRGAEGERLTSLLAEVLNGLACRHDAEVVFLPSYSVAHEGDDRVGEEIRTKITWKRSHVLRLREAPLYKAVLGELDLLITGRMHPAILAAPVATPVFALAYNPKFDGFFDLLGCPDRVLDVRQAVERGDAALLSARIEAAWHAGPLPQARIRELQDRIRTFTRDLVDAL